LVSLDMTNERGEIGPFYPARVRQPDGFWPLRYAQGDNLSEPITYLPTYPLPRLPTFTM
jgi:hypothetical protein